ncbi:hypothetical protein [Arenimonas donghaensis]|uniref:Uncharacterized protein n=1 Tax=Arenimonas donghaensis DSM 18148 = HO3-R19 TaxID=1121014 RepID=A0A087MJ37_9GAMM|nr:hypothetical protein [Arenimonas donghaensis]KFL36890.1 hypothetical protein N788_12240 [Arenimonas donghaensis DSM 18148 = HO3-R19]
MKLHSDITVNGRLYRKGEVAPKWFIYPFFLFHMGMFGLSGFFMAYGTDDVELSFLYAHGGIAILVYVVFYLAIFGLDQVRWMFINAALGLLGIWVEIGWILSLFGKRLGDYPMAVHVTPFLYYILYTFLIRQLVLDVFRARDKPSRKRLVEMTYIGLSLLVYGGTWLATR